MSRKLLDRIATLLKADAHGVVESLEERSLLLKQYVREAEIELNRKRAQLEALRDEEKRLREVLTRREEESRGLDEDIALALAGGKDDLARFAIRRLLPRRSEAKAVSARRSFHPSCKRAWKSWPPRARRSRSAWRSTRSSSRRCGRGYEPSSPARPRSRRRRGGSRSLS